MRSNIQGERLAARKFSIGTWLNAEVLPLTAHREDPVTWFITHYASTVAGTYVTRLAPPQLHHFTPSHLHTTSLEYPSLVSNLTTILPKRAFFPPRLFN